jgi:cysteine-rich repeat protein
MRALPILAIALLVVACGDNIKPVIPDEPVIICGNGVLEAGEECDDHNTMKDTVCDATCHLTCGNGVLDADVGELCDTKIASGPGACPTSCNDNQACTDDVLSGTGCLAECVHSAITAKVNGDGCCPAGADASTDDDCSSICGNGIVEPGEACDKGIVAGAGACPTACDDGMACTSNVLSNPNTCQAVCTFPPITTPMNGDSCCPAGANATNDNDCAPMCGNGVLEPTETCDTGIASGPGACPTACDDGLVCTRNVLSNAGTCLAMCTFPPITTPANGDGCCPAGANATNDSDCLAVCGNGIVEPSETCDTAIASGPGACPTSCNDNNVCTSNVLGNPGTCQAVCVFPPITTPTNGDGCCPAGANANNDNDCLPVCGNGVVEPPTETCDTAITSGPSACPTSCNDNNACTTNVLNNAGTCRATCTFPPITTPTNGDGCCPAGANANNDNDCLPVCGNGVVETGEQCDDGNTNNTDACSNTCTTNILPTAFRFSDLDLRDPHVWVSFLTCNDVTDNSLAGFSVNGQIQTQIQTDGNADGFLDLSPTLVFRPFSQTAATMPVELHFATCTAPMSSTTCTATSGGMVVMGTATNQTTGTCLAPLPGTTRPYTPAIATPTAPCFVSNAVTLTINIGGIPITLHDAQVAARYVGNPATSLSNGLLRGFISEADANATIIPASFPLVGGKPLSSLLAGGSGACPSFSDKDTDNGVVGWWFYLNFPATKVPWN